MMENILVTGGLGFIGLNLIATLSKSDDYFIHNIDNFSLGHTFYEDFLTNRQKDKVKNYKFDINEKDRIFEILQEHKVKKCFHLAAESHVDRSISNPIDFLNTNIIGTYNLLQCSRFHYHSLKDLAKSQFRFLHVSTDEVFGDLENDQDFFTEDTSYAPSSPYSASKASSDHLVRAWGRTFGLPVLISNCSNNYGPYHFPEKLVPVIILNALHRYPNNTITIEITSNTIATNCYIPNQS